MHSLKCSRFELESLEAFDHQSLNRRGGRGQKAGVGSLFDYRPFNLLWFHQTKLELHL